MNEKYRKKFNERVSGTVLPPLVPSLRDPGRAECLRRPKRRRSCQRL